MIFISVFWICILNSHFPFDVFIFSCLIILNKLYTLKMKKKKQKTKNKELDLMEN